MPEGSAEFEGWGRRYWHFTWCLEVPDGQWAAGQAIPSIFRTLVSLGRVCLTRTTRRDEGGLSRETLIVERWIGDRAWSFEPPGCDH